MRYAGRLSPIARQEMADQQDMKVRAERLAAFKLATADKAWSYAPHTMEWSLVTVVSGDPQCPA